MRILAYIFAFVLFGSSFAQETNFSLVSNKSKALIGETIEMKVLFQYSADIDESSIGFPIISDSTNLGDSVEIWSISPSQERSSLDNMGNAQMYFEQDFTLTSFDSGMIEIGPITALIGDDSIHSNVVSILFQPVAVDTTMDFKDIKSIVEDPLTTWEKIKIWLKDNWHWLVAILAAILTTIIIIVIRKRKPEKVEFIPTVPLSITLLEKLDQIEQEKLWQNNKNKLYYSELTGVLWQYLENRYGIATFEKTSNEIIANLKLKAISKDHIILLEKLFQLADMVKFAKTLPSGLENEEAIDIIRRMIKETRTDIELNNKEE